MYVHIYTLCLHDIATISIYVCIYIYRACRYCKHEIIILPYNIVSDSKDIFEICDQYLADSPVLV